MDTVYKLSLSGPPVTIRLNYWSPKKGVKASNKLGQCHRESYQQQQPNFHWMKGRKKIEHLPNKDWPSLNSEERLKILDKGCSISDLSLPLFLLVCLWALPCCHVGLALQGCLSLFNYCNSGPPTECLHLALSEVRDGKILQKISEIIKSSAIKFSSLSVYSIEKICTPSISKIKKIVSFTPMRLFVVSIRRTLF